MDGQVVLDYSLISQDPELCLSRTSRKEYLQFHSSKCYLPRKNPNENLVDQRENKIFSIHSCCRESHMKTATSMAAFEPFHPAAATNALRPSEI